MSRDDLYGSGYFLTYRDWQDDPDLKDDTPFPKLLAWEWMVGEARFIEDSSSFLKMGDLSHSVRYMAKCWNWDKSKVSRFIKKLESKGWIKVKNVKIGETPNETGAETRNETVHRVITICNYREIQRKDRGSETPSETSLETPNETILKKEKIKIKKTPLPPLEGGQDSNLFEFKERKPSAPRLDKGTYYALRKKRDEGKMLSVEDENFIYDYETVQKKYASDLSDYEKRKSEWLKQQEERSEIQSQAAEEPAEAPSNIIHIKDRQLKKLQEDFDLEDTEYVGRKLTYWHKELGHEKLFYLMKINRVRLSVELQREPEIDDYAPVMTEEIKQKILRSGEL